MAEGTIAWDIVARDHASAAFDKVSKSAANTDSTLSRFKNSTSAAGSQFGALGSTVSSAVAGFTAAGAAVGAIMAVASKSVDAYIGLTDQVREFGQRTGASAEDASRFVAVMDDYSISAEAGEKALFKLGQNITTNKDQLAALGITAARTSDGQLDLVGTIENVADAYTRTSDPGKRAQLVMASLGKSGAELIPILEQGGAGMRALFEAVPRGQVFNDADLRQAQEFKLAVDDMHDAVTETAIAFGKTLVPALGETATNIATVVRAVDDFTHAIGLGGMGPLIADMVKAINPALGALDLLALALNHGKDPSKEYADHQAELAKALNDVADSAPDAAGGLDAIAKAQQSAIDATFGYADAQDRLKSDQSALTDAQRDYQDALHGTGKYAEAQTAATDKLRSSQEALLQTQRRIRDLTESVGDKQAALTEAIFHYGSGSKQAQDAARDLRGDEEALSDARADAADKAEAVTRAEEDLAKVKDLSAARADAADKLADAERNLTRDVYNTAKSHVELGIKMGEANGQTFTATQQTALLRSEIEKLRDTSIPADSPLMTSLGAIVALLDPNATPGPKFAPGPPAVPASGLAPGAVGSGGLASGATGANDLSEGAVGVGGLQAQGNTIVFNYPVPPDQVAAYVEAATGTAY
jgi:uncharacterized phage infection (PIP) family protein YhgE